MMGNSNVREAADKLSGDADDLQGPRAAHSSHPYQQQQGGVHGQQQRLRGYPHHQQSEGGTGRLSHAGSSESMGHLSDSPGSSARSPLMFTPQIPMVPIHKEDEFSTGPFHSGVYDSQAYNDHGVEKGIATMIVWSHGGNEVFVEGSWDIWRTRQPLQKSGKDFTLLKILPSGVYQYKFIVDGQWRYAADLPLTQDEMGNVTNLLDVQDYVPENLDNIVGFEPPRSPESSYNNPFPGQDDYAKEPPMVPPHLHLTLLNAPPALDAPGALPRPQHVILNHLYVEKGKSSRSVLALGSTHRYRSKYVTVVLYKPLRK
ncbi:hypothetical protein O6H91_07G067400 [Diphasiastrum complanatum]|uniref:Uncharacterized protein n=1 Tax=Diphasiastrum complanatum TaxID=34168 RepID=A0ACC2D639_DIPCM|nr:hypothetical protein O6H91_07G067400 [Diphasiastrum complanatum]